MEGELALVIDDCVSCIVSALETDNQIGVHCQIVYDAAFSFIAPLGSYN